MNYNYKHETGALITTDDKMLRLVKGNAGSVDFPAEIIWNLHQKNPGIVSIIAHTHPPQFSSYSSVDQKLFEGWIWALHPFPVRMAVISQLKESEFTLTYWYGQLEGKEEWLTRNKVTPREITIIEESSEVNSPWHYAPWVEYLINQSYEKETII